MNKALEWAQRTIRKFNKKFSRENVKRRLKKAQENLAKRYPSPGIDLYADMGRRLVNYERVHHFFLQRLSPRGLRKKTIIHLGAGNGVYMDFLKRRYGANTIALEKNGEYIEQNLPKPYVRADAKQIPIKTGTADIILSDHFLLTGYQYDLPIVEEAHRVLKPGGLLVFERVTRTTDSDRSIEAMYFIKKKFRAIVKENSQEKFLVFAKK